MAAATRGFSPAIDRWSEEHSISRHWRVLIVEDNADAADALRTLLTHSGHEVRVADTGAEALATAARWRPDCVLCDLRLPDMSGCDVAAGLRTMPEIRPTLLVALTGDGQPVSRREAEEAGFDRHLLKPVEPGALLALLADG